MTTAANNSPSSPASGPSLKGVLCAECDHLNPPGSTRCETCQADLYRACAHCGQLFQTALSRCYHCGTRTHRRHARRKHKKREIKTNSLWLVCGVILLIMLAVLYKVFQRVGGMNFGF